jgi:ribosomal protein L11 methylase PrmA
MKNETIPFRVNKDIVVDLLIPHGVFMPNLTTALCAQVGLKLVKPNATILDLGCGTGAVGIILAQHTKAKTPIFASDLSPIAVQSAISNFKKHNIQSDCRVSSLFDAWSGMKFDYIFDDISGISEDLVEISPWFADGVPCNSGPTGIELSVRVIDQASKYLGEGGLILPVLSLSNRRQVIEKAKQSFQYVEQVAIQEWPMPREMLEHKPQLEKIRRRGDISYQEKFNHLICTTEIFYCSNSKRGE